MNGAFVLDEEAINTDGVDGGMKPAHHAAFFTPTGSATSH